MLFFYMKKYWRMILASIFFFNLGCGITLSLVQIDRENAASKKSEGSALTDSLGIQYAVLVLSGPHNEERRDTIRQTWAKLLRNIVTENGVTVYRWSQILTTPSEQHDLIKVFFVIGAQGLDEIKMDQLNNENNNYKDILLLYEFEDSYKNLTTKLLMSLKWLNINMKSLKYVIKCDDDSFVRIDLIVKELDAFAPAMDSLESKKYISYKNKMPSYNGLYWGYFHGAAHVYLSGKWQEKDWFLCDSYLPYALGGGYVASRSIVDYIVRNADLLSRYNSEDVSMGVWTAALDNINRVHDIRFDTQWKSRGCSPHMLVRHKQTPEDMTQMYKSLLHSHGSRLCIAESSLMKAYIYNWNVLPSMCCNH